jgi:3-oxoacyl-[acyl-carrier-protein] synthase-3
VTLHLHAVGHFHPDPEVTNRFLQELDIGVDDAWIIERTGIRSRRSLLPLEYIRSTRNRDPAAALEAASLTTAQMGARAGAMALGRAGIEPRRVGLVIASASSSTLEGPAEASSVAQALGIDAPALDVRSAFTSLFAGLWMLSRMEAERLPPFVLVVASEALTRTVDYRDPVNAVLLGDAAAAVLVSRSVPGRARILDLEFGSDPARADQIRIPRLGHFTQRGRAVQRFAITRLSSDLERLRSGSERAGRPFHFIGHQGNLRMLEAVCRRSGLPESRHHANVEWYGNTGAASGVSVLSQLWDKWQPEDDVAMSSVGGGLSWSGFLLRFGATP